MRDKLLFLTLALQFTQLSSLRRLSTATTFAGYKSYIIALPI